MALQVLLDLAFPSDPVCGNGTCESGEGAPTQGAPELGADAGLVEDGQEVRVALQAVAGATKTIANTAPVWIVCASAVTVASTTADVVTSTVCQRLVGVAVRGIADPSV